MMMLVNPLSLPGFVYVIYYCYYVYFFFSWPNFQQRNACSPIHGTGDFNGDSSERWQRFFGEMILLFIDFVTNESNCSKICMSTDSKKKWHLANSLQHAADPADSFTDCRARRRMVDGVAASRQMPAVEWLGLAWSETLMTSHDMLDA